MEKKTRIFKDVKSDSCVDFYQWTKRTGLMVRYKNSSHIGLIKSEYKLKEILEPEKHNEKIIELKPCPFCGTIPETLGNTIHCPVSKCMGYEIKYYLPTNLIDLVISWNMRYDII